MKVFLFVFPQDNQYRSFSLRVSPPDHRSPPLRCSLQCRCPRDAARLPMAFWRFLLYHLALSGPNRTLFPFFWLLHFQDFHSKLLGFVGFFIFLFFFYFFPLWEKSGEVEKMNLWKRMRFSPRHHPLHPSPPIWQLFGSKVSPWVSSRSGGGFTDHLPDGLHLQNAGHFIPPSSFLIFSFFSGTGTATENSDFLNLIPRWFFFNRSSKVACILQIVMLYVRGWNMLQSANIRAVSNWCFSVFILLLYYPMLGPCFYIPIIGGTRWLDHHRGRHAFFEGLVLVELPRDPKRHFSNYFNVIVEQKYPLIKDSSRLHRLHLALDDLPRKISSPFFVQSKYFFVFILK